MRRMLVTICTLAIAALSGCGSDSATAPTTVSAIGTWNLTTINGAPLPFTFQAANPKLEILSDQYILAADGTFTESFQLRATDGTGISTQAFSDRGTYSVNGTALVVVYTDGSRLTASLSANAVTIAQQGAALVYSRQ